MTANKACSLQLRAMPLPESVVKVLEENVSLLKMDLSLDGHAQREHRTE